MGFTPARAANGVDAVPEAHHLLLVSQRMFHPGLGPGCCLLQGFLRTGADLIEGVHDGFIGAPVQGTLERANGCGDG